MTTPLFGEDQSRYLLIINKKKEFETLANKNNIESERIGFVTGAFLNFKNLPIFKNNLFLNSIQKKLTVLNFFE